jgi:hypothetical protein
MNRCGVEWALFNLSDLHIDGVVYDLVWVPVSMIGIRFAPLGVNKTQWRVCGVFPA